MAKINSSKTELLANNDTVGTDPDSPKSYGSLGYTPFKPPPEKDRESAMWRN
jgi:hypothetical protein